MPEDYEYFDSLARTREAYYSEPDPHDLADRIRDEPDRDGCDLCNVVWNDEDNEDDIVQGFHADCAEEQANNAHFE